MSDDPKIQELRELKAQTRVGGGPERIERQHKRGRMTARERIDSVLLVQLHHRLVQLLLIVSIALFQRFYPRCHLPHVGH